MKESVEKWQANGKKGEDLRSRFTKKKTEKVKKHMKRCSVSMKDSKLK